MNWVRRHIKAGARLALLALAVQLVLSFGHVHHDVALAAPQGVAAAQAPTDSGPAPAHPPHQADPCAICAVMAMAGPLLFAAPPVLLLPQATELLQALTEAEFSHLGVTHGAPQPRGPPLS